MLGLLLATTAGLVVGGGVGLAAALVLELIRRLRSPSRTRTLRQRARAED